jgi:hypothetical protein
VSSTITQSDADHFEIEEIDKNEKQKTLRNSQVNVRPNLLRFSISMETKEYKRATAQ